MSDGDLQVNIRRQRQHRLDRLQTVGQLRRPRHLPARRRARCQLTRQLGDQRADPLRARKRNRDRRQRDLDRDDRRQDRSNLHGNPTFESDPNIDAAGNHACRASGSAPTTSSAPAPRPRRRTPTAEPDRRGHSCRAQARAAAVELDKRTYEGEAQQQPARPGRRRRRPAARRRLLPARRRWAAAKKKKRPNSAEAPAATVAAPERRSRQPRRPPRAGRAGRAPPRRLRAPVTRAFAADQTVVLLFVRDGGIDDRMVTATSSGSSGFAGSPPSSSRPTRSPATRRSPQGVDVNRVPALVVVRPKQPRPRRPDRLGPATASRAPQSVVQAVIDAGYKGRTLDYHP